MTESTDTPINTLKVIPLGFNPNKPRPHAPLGLGLRMRALPILSQRPSSDQEPIYGWELLHYRLGAYCPAHPLTQGFDFLPTQFPHSFRQFALYHNLFSIAGLWNCYDKVVVALPPEILHKLAAIAKAGPLGQAAFFYRRNGGADLVHFIESTAPELVALKEVPSENLGAIATFARPLSERATNAHFSHVPEFPPQNAFIPWLESLALLQESRPEAEQSTQLQLAEIAPCAGLNTLFICSVQQFREILALTYSPEFLDYAEFMHQGQAGNSAKSPQSLVPFSGRRSVSLFKASPKSQLEFSATLPVDLAEFARSREKDAASRSFQAPIVANSYISPDAVLVFTLEKIFQGALLKYEAWTKIKLRRTSLDAMQQFLAKMLSFEQKTSLTAFDLVLAAKACVDGNFSAKVAETLEDFTSVLQTSHSSLHSLEELTVKLSDVFQNTQVLELGSFVTFEHIKSQRTHPRAQGSKNRAKDAFSRPRLAKTETSPVGGEERAGTSSQDHSSAEPDRIDQIKTKYKDASWVENESGYHCSFPDEDFFLDTAVYHLTKKTKSQFFEKSEKSIPIATSLEEGIDIRNTIRNWHTGEIYARTNEKNGNNRIGAVVYNFTTEDRTERHYTWKALWNAEEHDATHLMFFATPFRDEIIGPGIARSTFGGFAALPAENRVYDLWNHPWLSQVSQSDAEQLLLAAAFCSNESAIVYVAQNMPRRALLDILRQNQKHVVFVSIGSVNQNQIRRLRTFHVLAEPAVRIYAQSFIQKDTGDSGN